MRCGRQAPPALALAALVVGCALGCATPHRPATVAAPARPCPSPASPSLEAAICERDEAIHSLRARFRADVDVGGATRTAEGVLVWRAPDALRVKLFTLAGLTVYDALWVGDGTRVRGLVRQPLAARDATFDLGPDETLDAPDADLSLVLWALWRPRCALPPVASRSDPASFALDPGPARATAREVVVADQQVQVEVLRRAARAGGEVERVVARYDDYDCTQAPALPRRIAVEAPGSGWQARVTILEQQRNVVLDDALFTLPEGASGDAGS